VTTISLFSVPRTTEMPPFPAIPCASTCRSPTHRHQVGFHSVTGQWSRKHAEELLLNSISSQALKLHVQVLRDDISLLNQISFWIHRKHNWFAILATNQRSGFLLTLKSFVHNDFRIAIHFHWFHLNQIPNSHIPNGRHFAFVLLSSQSQFLVTFKFFVHHAFHTAIRFLQFRLKLIQNWHTSTHIYWSVRL
jgi:hypothetical protein